jgi:hypothetical protein
LAFCFCFYNQARADETSNLLNPSDIEGIYNNCTPGVNCWSGYSGGNIPNWSGSTAYWGYGGGILKWQIALEQALRNAGINLDGYKYSWRLKNFDTNSEQNDGDDYMRISVRLYDANGNEVWGKQHNYDGHYLWSYFTGTELFNKQIPGSTVDKIIIRAEGDDPGFWAGYYGPEFDVGNSSFQLIYSVDQCFSNPLHDPSCPGYAEAYAQQQYDLNCAANPLYDSGCPGYQTAYYNQQCSIDPLYDSGCPGYAQAYFDQQCGLDPFYDTTCPGYAQAYFDQQCGLDPFYDTTCPGYAEAYFAQQCSLDTLYDPGCPGYEEYVLSLIPDSTATEDESHHTETTTPTVTVSDPVAELTQPKLVDDPIVNEILQETTPTVTVTVSEPVQEIVETTQTESANDDTQESESSGDVEIAMGPGGDDNEEQPQGGTSDGAEDGGEGGTESEKSSGNDDAKDSKREKMKQLVAEKAKNLANDMAGAANMAAQKALQAQVLALINYTPGFDTYGVSISGGYYPDAQMYTTEQLPESKRGLRNGLAQQLLHEKMVEMQYK